MRNEQQHHVVIKYGDCWNHICQGKVVSGVVSQKTIVNLSMEYSGFCALELLGEIYRPAMKMGVQYISNSVDGEIKVSEKNHLKFW